MRPQTLALLFLAIAASGCNHSQQDNILFAAMVAAQAADGYTTTRCLGIGGRELNPVLDDHPNDEGVLLFKAGVVGVLYGLGQLCPEHRQGFYTTGIISGSVAAGWNQYQYEKH